MSPAELRRSMCAGIAFVVLFVVGVFVTFGNSADIKGSDSEATAAGKYVDIVSSSSHRTGLVIGAYLLIAAGLAFIWFTVGLRSRLSSVSAGRLVSALGVAGAGAMMAGGISAADVAGAIAFGDQPVPKDGDAIMVVMNLADPLLLLVFPLVCAAIIATVAVHARRSGLPAWLGYTGWLGVIGSIFAVIFLPMVLPLLWFLAVAIVVLMRPGVATTTQDGGSMRHNTAATDSAPARSTAAGADGGS